MTEQERFEQSVAARLLYPARFTKVGENPILGWTAAKDTDYVNHNIQEHWETWQAATAQVPQGCVVVKPALDSKAKAKMIGEYTFKADAICPDCVGDGCDLCNHGSRDVDVYVPWTTIKQIYKDGVSCMIKAAQENNQ